MLPACTPSMTYTGREHPCTAVCRPASVVLWVRYQQQNCSTEETGLLAACCWRILVLLLRGDLAKSLISAFLAELRFRAPPPCFFYGSRAPDSERHACAPAEASWPWWFDVFCASHKYIQNHGIGDVWQTNTVKGISETIPGEKCYWDRWQWKRDVAEQKFEFQRYTP